MPCLQTVACLGLVSLLLGCAGSNQGPQVAEANAPATPLERYLPLKNDTVFSYETYIEESTSAVWR